MEDELTAQTAPVKMIQIFCATIWWVYVCLCLSCCLFHCFRRMFIILSIGLSIGYYVYRLQHWSVMESRPHHLRPRPHHPRLRPRPRPYHSRPRPERPLKSETETETQYFSCQIFFVHEKHNFFTGDIGIYR